ncbi:TPA: ead/Ea22-like family protein [Klebsiella pneumoniae]
MTDSTELAQSLKAAAIDAKELAIIARYSKGRAAAEKFYALANPNNVIALVEALEKAQQRNGELETYSKTALEFREAARDENRHLKLELEIAEKRIAELESRTVKLPKAMSIEGGAYCSAHAHYDSDGDYYDRTDVEEMLAAAGIKVEAE